MSPAVIRRACPSLATTPDDKANRAQAVTMVGWMLDRLGSDEPPLTEGQSFGLSLATENTLVNSASVAPGGGYVLAGHRSETYEGDADAPLLKVDDSGQGLWTRAYGGRRDQRFERLAPTGDGGFALAGYRQPGGLNMSDAWLARRRGLLDAPSAPAGWRKLPTAA